MKLDINWEKSNVWVIMEGTVSNRSQKPDSFISQELGWSRSEDTTAICASLPSKYLLSCYCLYGCRAYSPLPSWGLFQGAAGGKAPGVAPPQWSGCPDLMLLLLLSNWCPLQTWMVLHGKKEKKWVVCKQGQLRSRAEDQAIHALPSALGGSSVGSGSKLTETLWEVWGWVGAGRGGGGMYLKALRLLMMWFPTNVLRPKALQSTTVMLSGGWRFSFSGSSCKHRRQ